MPRTCRRTLSAFYFGLCFRPNPYPARIGSEDQSQCLRFLSERLGGITTYGLILFGGPPEWVNAGCLRFIVWLMFLIVVLLPWVSVSRLGKCWLCAVNFKNIVAAGVPVAQSASHESQSSVHLNWKATWPQIN